MSNRVGLLFAGFILAVASIVCVIGSTWDRWWYQVDEFQPSPGSNWNITVYKSTKGNILFFENNDGAVVGYIFDTIQQRIAQAPYSKMYILPYVAFDSETPLPVEWNDRDYKLTVEGSRIDFTPLIGIPIQADISKY